MENKFRLVGYNLPAIQTIRTTKSMLTCHDIEEQFYNFK